MLETLGIDVNSVFTIFAITNFITSTKTILLQRFSIISWRYCTSFPLHLGVLHRIYITVNYMYHESSETLQSLSLLTVFGEGNDFQNLSKPWKQLKWPNTLHLLPTRKTVSENNGHKNWKTFNYVTTMSILTSYHTGILSLLLPPLFDTIQLWNLNTATLFKTPSCFLYCFKYSNFFFIHVMSTD